jgi:hypothetical protein
MNKTAPRAAILAIAFIVSIPLGLKAQDEGFFPYSFARLSYVNGTVYVQRASDLGYEQGEVNLALVQGDKMGTESGQAEVHFGKRNYLRLDDNTKVEFALLPSEGDERIRLHLTEGRIYLRVSALAVDKGIEIHTPDASFYVLEEGLYRIDVRPDGETRAFAREGSLEAAVEAGSVLVGESQTVTAVDGRLLGDPEYDNAREDGFDTWNGSRDTLLMAKSGKRYLPSEIEEYEEELEENGHWVYERPYGNVWVPNVSYVDWRPYLYGRWVWYPVIGWTWVSSEPWGWSVYHYGRWHWRFGLGWYWIPRSHWGPAWVHWWWDGGYIGWCPLSWYNRPVVIVNNNFYDRYYDRFFPARNRAMTIVRRDQLQDHRLARREVGLADRDRIGRVELRREQPSLRPVVDNGRPQALAAKRALAPRSGVRNEVRRVAPSSSLSPSHLRPREASPASRARGRDASVDPAGRDAAAVRPSLRPSSGRDQGALSGDRGGASESRTIRSYPSRREAASPDRSGAAVNRRSPAGSADRGSARGSTESPARVTRNGGNSSAPSQPRAVREPQKAATGGKGSVSTATRKGETIKKYPSSARLASAPARSSSRASSSLSSVSRASSRSNASPSSSSRPSASIARPSSSARSSSSSSVRTSPSRAPSTSRPRSSYAAPSRSSGSSSRSIAPSRPSSSGRSSSGAARSSGSSLGRSSSASSRSSGSSGSGRSASSSKSSGSSSKSGSVKRKH